MAYHHGRTVTTLGGVYRLTLRLRRCRNPACPAYHRPYRPEEAGAWALPHGDFGLAVIALVGRLRCAEHRSIPEIHRALLARGGPRAARTGTDLAPRDEALVARRLADQTRLRDRLAEQERVILAPGALWAVAAARPRA